MKGMCRFLVIYRLPPVAAGLLRIPSLPLLRRGDGILLVYGILLLEISSMPRRYAREFLLTLPLIRTVVFNDGVVFLLFSFLGRTCAINSQGGAECDPSKLHNPHRTVVHAPGGDISCRYRDTPRRNQGVGNGFPP